MNFLALRMLMGDKAKYLGIVCGVMLAALLMSHQVTIFVGLMSRTRSTFQTLDHANIIVADPATEFVEDTKPLSDTDVLRVRAVEGVEWAVGLFRQPLRVRLPEGKFRTCVVVGLDDATLIGGPSKMAIGSLDDLRKTDGVIIDRLDAIKLLSSRSPEGKVRVPTVGDSIEVNDRRLKIVAISDNPRPFLSQPIIYTTISRAREIAPPERRQLNFILAKARAGPEGETEQIGAQVRAAIAQQTGLASYTRQSFGWKTIGYFISNTGIPVNFGVTVLLGCIVGIAISGQTFYLFTLDNLKNLAALKAMGASTAQLVRMVLLQAAVVGVQGYAIGVGFTSVFFVAFIGTDLEFQVHWEVLAMTAAAIVVVIIIATAVSLRAVLRVEPGLVFRG